MSGHTIQAAIEPARVLEGLGGGAAPVVAAEDRPIPPACAAGVETIE